MQYALAVIFLVLLALAMPQSTRAAQATCERMFDEANRAQCIRAQQLERAMSSLCDTDALRKDRVACLEAKVAALTRELAELRYAMQPRLHQ